MSVSVTCKVPINLESSWLAYHRSNQTDLVTRYEKDDEKQITFLSSCGIQYKKSVSVSVTCNSIIDNRIVLYSDSVTDLESNSLAYPLMSSQPLTKYEK